MYLVTGATGNVGHHVVDQLLSAGKSVRVVTRDPSKVAHWNRHVQVANGDVADSDFFIRALDGAEAVFVMNGGLSTETFARNMSAAKDYGSPRIVFLSSILVHHPQMKLGGLHRAMEDSVRNRGLHGHFLHPGGFMSNAYQWIPSIKADATVRNATGAGRSAPVAPEDIAAVAARALVEPDSVPQSCDITGPELLSVRQQVDILSHTLGRTIQCVDVPVEAAVQGMIKSGVPAETAAAVGEAVGGTAEGRFEIVADTVEKVMGRRATSFEEWAKRHASRFA